MTHLMECGLPVRSIETIACLHIFTGFWVTRDRWDFARIVIPKSTGKTMQDLTLCRMHDARVSNQLHKLCLWLTHLHYVLSDLALS